MPSVYLVRREVVETALPDEELSTIANSRPSAISLRVAGVQKRREELREDSPRRSPLAVVISSPLVPHPRCRLSMDDPAAAAHCLSSSWGLLRYRRVGLKPYKCRQDQAWECIAAKPAAERANMCLES